MTALRPAAGAALDPLLTVASAPDAAPPVLDAGARPAACVLLALALLCPPGRRGAGRLRVMLRPDGARRAAVAPRTAGVVLAGAAAGAVVAGPAGLLAGGGAAAVWWRRRARRRGDREAGAAAAQLAEALGRVTDELRAGAHPAAALGGAGGDGPLARAVLEPAATAARLGDGVPEALRRVGRARPELAADVERVARAWTVAERHGVPLAGLLAGVHADLRWRGQYAERVRAQLAGPRATAAVLAALPAVGIVLGELVGAAPLAVLRTAVAGQGLLVVGTGLALAGTLWADRILRSAVPR